jgi:pyridinium-3,5-biscarboxylic acid mononucleotide synthase
VPRTRRPGGRSPGREADLVVGDVGRIDLARSTRTGVPEVILAEGKRSEDLRTLLVALGRAGVGALVSRPTPFQRELLRGDPELVDLGLEELAGGRLLRLPGPIGLAPPPGRVALVTAGTSDLPLAEEAKGVLRTLGVPVDEAHDVGVAGLHRLLGAVRRLERRRPSVYLAFAGREGALPTVLAGLVAAPVVGVPSSVGYGRGGAGEAALSAMLQSCAPIAVVNVDAAVPAALFALQLLGGARRASRKTER